MILYASITLVNTYSLVMIMITMAEIARLTHVSQPTVSRVLNGNIKVDPEIRERVLACAKEHNYQFNALAKGLQGSKTQLMGVILTDISNGFFADLAKQIEIKARKKGYSIILFNSRYDLMLEKEYMNVVRRYHVDGVLAVPIRENSSEWMESVRGLDVPLVVVTRHAKDLDSVHLDHDGAGELVAGHLLERGYKRFLFIGRSYDAKYIGFRRGLAKLGINPEQFVQNIEFQNDAQLLQDLDRYFQVYKQFRTGIFAYNDICAFHVLDILRKLNISVTQQCGVIGFDNTEVGSYMVPKLSSVSQPIEEMAAEAVDRLIYRIENPGEHPVWRRSLQAALSVKNST